ncbi:beta strand repeat-containing protein, partial [Neopusillimonas maritima]
SASVSTTDAAGNSTSASTSQGYTVDTEIDASITVDDITSDNVINAAESGGDVTLTGTVGGDVQDGDTVTVTIGTNEYTATVENGAWSVSVPGSVLAENSTVSASVSTTDAAGNSTSASTSQGYTVDTEIDASITVDDITSDNVVNAAESGGDVTVSGSVGGDVQDGDTVTVTVNGQTYTTQVADGAWSVDVAGSELAADSAVNVSVTTTDAAGNSATATAEHTYNVDTEVSATIAIDTIAGDDVINAAEAEGDVTLTGTVGGDVQDGDTVTITVGENSYEATVSGGTWSVSVPGSVLTENSNVSASVTTTDAAGNTANASTSQGYTVDTEIDASITVNDITEDNVINAAESGGDVTVSGSVGGDVQDGDTVTITVNGQTYTTQVADGAWSVDVAGSDLAADTTVDVSVTTTDAAGNSATATAEHTYSVDTEVSATITIDTIAGDDVINAAEAEANITLTGTVGGDVQDGDTVTVTVGTNEYTATVEDGAWSVSVPGSVLANNSNVSASVSTTDAAGNTANASTSQGYTVDTEIDASITVNDITEDNVINAAESGGDVTVSGSVGGDVQDGDTVTVTVNGQTYTTQVADGVWSVDVAGADLAADSAVNVSVTTTDAAGNTATATAEHTYGVDTEVSATISIDTIAGDDVINAAEAEGDVTLTGTVGGDVQDGDTVTVTVGENSYEATVSGGTWSVSVPGSALATNSNVSASVTTTDAAGNSTSASSTQGYTVDTEIDASITVNDITEDNVINAAESGGDVTVSGSVGGDVQDGDTVTVTVNGQTYTTQVADGAWSVDVAGANLAADTSIDVSVTTTDAAGNSATATAEHTYGVDTEVSATIAIDTIAGDDVINAAEAEGDVTLTGTVGGDVQDGDTVTITVGENSYEATVSGGTWSVSVPGSVLAENSNVSASVSTTDTAGNTANASTSQGYTVDTEIDASITVNDITEDNVINAAESGGDVTVGGSVGGDVQDGDTVTVTVNGQTYTTQVADGAWSVDVAGSDLAADTTVDVSVTTTDAAGNSATATAEHTYSVDTEVSATIAIDTIAGDDVINAAEAEGDVTLTGAVGGDVQDGDTVTVTVGENSYEATVSGGTWSVSVPGSVLANNSNVSASVSTTDAAGNTANASTSQGYTVDTEIDASITVDDITADNIVNAAEADTDVTVSGSVGGDVQDGDTVTVTVNGQTYTTQVADGAWSVDVAGSDLAADTTVDVSVTTTDAAGNSATATAEHTYSVDTEVSATIAIDTIAGDDVINAAEAEGDVTLTGTVGGDVQDGDTVTITVGENSYEATVSGGTWSVSVLGSVLAANSNVSASVTITDAAGNSTSASTSQGYTVDTEIGASITVNDITS